MSSTLDSDVLVSEYAEEIRSWDWKAIIKWFDFHSDSPDYYEQDGDGRYVYQWIGTVFGLTPSGKIYALWTTNQTEEDVLRDSAWWEALETVAKQNGCFVSTPEWADGDDIFLCRRYDMPEEPEDEDD